MSIHSHPFPLNSYTSFMHIHFRVLPNISPTQLTKRANNQMIPYCCHTRTDNRKSCCCHIRTNSKKRSLVVATQEPAVRKESLLLPHKNQQWEEIKQLLEVCSFQISDFFFMHVETTNPIWLQIEEMMHEGMLCIQFGGEVFLCTNNGFWNIFMEIETCMRTIEVCNFLM